MQKTTPLRRHVTIGSTALILMLTLTSVVTLFGQDDNAELRLRATPRVAFAQLTFCLLGKFAVALMTMRNCIAWRSSGTGETIRHPNRRWTVIPTSQASVKSGVDFQSGIHTITEGVTRCDFI